MVDTDNAKGKGEFRKLSKTMSDNNIEELEASGFWRNASTKTIRQRAAKKERSCEARPAAVHAACRQALRQALERVQGYTEPGPRPRNTSEAGPADAKGAIVAPGASVDCMSFTHCD
ncbi:hypothetical protein K488DRAFT_92561 [Vararia minispora EC-137]|uniref:Uncharacterized protein n=1 Tax=Vararia minispora EC-137 TaxID=1314806 RepID=A0ACB8Q3Y7_9AGAM|nr:hypothetical protein K488DRAFT_92561 [Vararia minispora EC-137]